MTISESGITLQLPDNNAFRFQDCSGFKELKGKSFRPVQLKKAVLWWKNHHHEKSLQNTGQSRVH